MGRRRLDPGATRRGQPGTESKSPCEFFARNVGFHVDRTSNIRGSGIFVIVCATMGVAGMRELIPSAVIFAILSAATSAPGQGVIVHGVGPVNRAMGGAGTAAPMDAIGALHWNSGSISALPKGAVSVGFELLLADVDLTSNIGGRKRTTSGEAGVAQIPSVGWVHHLEGGPITIGLGLYGIAGFRNNLPADPLNPLLASGPIYADAEFLQIAPTVSWAVSDSFAVGISPTITTAKVTMDPLGPSAITPLPTPGSGNRVHWGGGVQLGMYYIASSDWRFGFTIKSPQFFEDFRFFTPTGTTTFDMDYPMMLSLGTSYSGFRNWVIAVDTRYHDFKNTDGFSELGWSNVFAAAFGAQYLVNDCWRLRCGYNVNLNPIHESDVFANIATPLIQEQNVTAGASYRLSENVDLSLAYVYLVNNHVTGPLPPAVFGPGATITNEINAHSAVMGFEVSY